MEHRSDDLLLTKDVCQRLKLSPVTLWRLSNDGRFPDPDLIIGKLKRAWYRSTIESWIQKQASAQNKEQAA